MRASGRSHLGEDLATAKAGVTRSAPVNPSAFLIMRNAVADTSRLEDFVDQPSADLLQPRMPGERVHRHQVLVEESNEVYLIRLPQMLEHLHNVFGAVVTDVSSIVSRGVKHDFDISTGLLDVLHVPRDSKMEPKLAYQRATV